MNNKQYNQASRTIPVGISIAEVEIILSVPLNPRTDNILAFVEIKLGTSFIVRGITIKEQVRKDDGARFIKVDFPGFSTKYRPMKSFLIDDKDLWEVIVDEIMELYEEQVSIGAPVLVEKQDDELAWDKLGGK